MTCNLEHILELLPLQNYLDRQLFTNRVEITLEVHHPIPIFRLNLLCSFSRFSGLLTDLNAVELSLLLVTLSFLIQLFSE